MFSGDEIFGTRNKDGSWDLEITGMESDPDGNSQEYRATIKGASIEIEMSMHEAPNVRIIATDNVYVESKTKHLPLI